MSVCRIVVVAVCLCEQNDCLNGQAVLCFLRWVNNPQTGGRKCLLRSSRTHLSIWSSEQRCWHVVSQSTSVVNFQPVTVRPSRQVTIRERSFASAGPYWETASRMTLHLLHRWQCFDENLKHIYFGSHIRTLLCSSFVVLGEQFMMMMMMTQT